MRDWLRQLNRVLVGAGLVILLAGLPYLWWSGVSSLGKEKPLPSPPTMVETPHLREEAEYQKLGGPLLDLDFKPVSIQLPILNTQLLYYGQNTRPDFGEGVAPLQFGIRGQEEIHLTYPEQKVFLRFVKNQEGGKYEFVEGAKTTDLWFQADPEDTATGTVKVRVGMKNLRGELITEPADRREFTLSKAVAVIGRGGSLANRGGGHFGPSILMRMRAKWLGQDLFLERHGGPAYEDMNGKERIDIGEGPDATTLYLREGDTAILKDSKWQMAKVGKDETKPYPLLQLREVEKESKRLMVEMWQPQGAGAFKLSLPLMSRPFRFTPRFEGIRFMGARSSRVATLEIMGKREEVNQYDWLLFTDKGWERLDTLDEVNDYVAGKLLGELLVIDGIEREGGRQVLKAHVFNESRAEVRELSIFNELEGGKGAEAKTPPTPPGLPGSFGG